MLPLLLPSSIDIMTASSEASTLTLSEDEEPFLELAVLDGVAAVPVADGRALTILCFFNL